MVVLSVVPTSVIEAHRVKTYLLGIATVAKVAMQVKDRT